MSNVTRDEDDLRAHLVEIWRDVLVIAVPDADIDFMEVNGSSLDAVRIMNRVQTLLGRDDLEVGLIFDFSTPRTLATELLRQPE